jgi:predicted ATPase
MTEKEERFNTAHLNLKAAGKARQRSAFLPAGKYYEETLSLLGDGVWEDHHRLAMELHSSAATCYCMCGQGERSFELAEVVVKHATNVSDRAEAQHTQLQVLLQDRSRSMLYAS